MMIILCSQLYLTGAVYSLDGSDSLKETMQTSMVAGQKVSYLCKQTSLYPFCKRKETPHRSLKQLETDRGNKKDKKSVMRTGSHRAVWDHGA